MGAAARVRRSAAACLVALVAVVTGCTDAAPGRGDPSYLVVGYRDAAQRLAALDPLEAGDQLADWARLGLAASLGMSRDQVVDALYDTTPVRDPGFTDLVDQPVGPGRGLFDGETLHVLVEEGDPHESRTTGLVLDQYRADAGADPARVRLHHYRVDTGHQRVELRPDPPAATADVRRDHGWREARVDQPEGLAGFLADTDHLARLETRGGEVWAGGWRWEDAPAARITPDDVAVLQRGYDRTTGPLPGFSLDPVPPAGVDDIRAAVPDLAPDLLAAIGSGNWAGTGHASADDLAGAVEQQLLQPGGPADGLPQDRTQLWALRSALTGGPLFSQARYDGGLAGTEVGMTLFYTDLTAKLWVTGVGDGVPSPEVPGFVPDPDAPTPPDLCPRRPRQERGRLWYGQNDAAFAFSDTGVDIGAQATRLFSRSNGADGTEVEPSYGFARGLRFWDRHYLEVADYEPQYHRLEQLMRWSGALEWLTAKSTARLPMSPSGTTDPSFADWYARHTELRERAPLALVAPPSAQGEAVLAVPSKTTADCDLLSISGGVSLADGLARAGETPSGTAALPAGARRADPVDPATVRVDAATGAQHFDRVVRGGDGRVGERFTFDRAQEQDATSVRITGGPRESVPFADAPLHTPGGEREFRTEVRADGPNLVFDTEFQHASFASTWVRDVPVSGAPHRQVDITVLPGQLGLLERAAGYVRQDPVNGLANAPEHVQHYTAGDGEVVYRIGDAWVAVHTGHPSSRVLATREVVTPAGVVQVSLVLPRRLTGEDVGSLRPVDEGVAPAAEIPGRIPVGAAVYQADPASVVGAEPPGAVPAPIPADARVRFVVARPTREPGPAPSLPPRPEWVLSDGTRFPGGPADGRADPRFDPRTGAWTGVRADPAGGRYGGRLGSTLRGPGGWVVLLTVCSEEEQQSAPPSTTTAAPQEEVCR
ncbi:hypothetical protein [Saccharothrix syringae]|uniref:Uncharacterized protein n=1 Tax=Saccharothrix syringae TaxID=103733 RepID=A0A5Q0H0B0_SACSY|nr:hypothetical protein [Saccharothrix syringae]QFZ19629.1 hypothetical protein EKG83_21300 [Saccharothrix syringae]